MREERFTSGPGSPGPDNREDDGKGERCELDIILCNDIAVDVAGGIGRQDKLIHFLLLSDYLYSYYNIGNSSMQDNLRNYLLFSLKYLKNGAFPCIIEVEEAK